MKKIMILDDDKKFRSLMSRLLVSEGYVVVECQNALEANSLIKGSKTELLLLDIKMPEVDGGIFYEILGMFHPELKVIVVSALSREEQMRIIPGADGYHDKSLGAMKLLDTVREVIGYVKRQNGGTENDKEDNNPYADFVGSGTGG